MFFSQYANQKGYPFKLMELPYALESMQPHMSVETFNYHHGKHHATYVHNLNNLLATKPDMQQKSLEEIILASTGDIANKAIFNNAAQVWNHNFFWYSLQNNTKSDEPTGKLLEQINQDFGDYNNFIQNFQDMALKQFGSGWAWLVYDGKKLQIVTTSNAETPLTDRQFPLITCDVWEHAYYVDYRNNRAKYLQQFVSYLANWQFAENNFSHAIQLLQK